MKIKEQAQELASLLGATSPQATVVTSQSTEQVVDETPEELAPEPAFQFDYNKVKRYYQKKAKESIKKIVRVVINNPDIIDKSFIVDKIEQDAEQLAQLYYQQRKTEVMQEANMESVRTGNISPRMFETFNLLGKNLMDIAKQISDFQISIKENYAKIKFDALDDIPTPGNLIETSDSNQLGKNNIFKNTKEVNLALMEERKRRMIESRIESKEADFEEIKEYEEKEKEDKIK